MEGSYGRRASNRIIRAQSWIQGWLSKTGAQNPVVASPALEGDGENYTYKNTFQAGKNSLINRFKFKMIKTPKGMLGGAFEGFQTKKNELS